MVYMPHLPPTDAHEKKGEDFSAFRKASEQMNGKDETPDTVDTAILDVETGDIFAPPPTQKTWKEVLREVKTRFETLVNIAVGRTTFSEVVEELGEQRKAFKLATQTQQNVLNVLAIDSFAK